MAIRQGGERLARGGHHSADFVVPIGTPVRLRRRGSWSLFVYGPCSGRAGSSPRYAQTPGGAVEAGGGGFGICSGYGRGEGVRAWGPLQQGGGRGHRSLPPATPIWSVPSPRWPQPTSWCSRWRRSASFLSSGLLYLSGDMDSIKCLLLMVSSFMLYAHIEMMGSARAVPRHS